MPSTSMNIHLRPFSPLSNYSRQLKTHHVFTHAMSATRHNLAAQVDKPDRSQNDPNQALRVAEADMPGTSGSKVLVRMLARPVNPSGGPHATSLGPARLSVE